MYRPVNIRHLGRNVWALCPYAIPSYWTGPALHMHSVIQDYKRGDPEAIEHLAQSLARFLRTHRSLNTSKTLLIPIPESRAYRKGRSPRGLDLCERLGSLAGVRARPAHLLRRVKTVPRSHLTPTGRLPSAEHIRTIRLAWDRSLPAAVFKLRGREETLYPLLLDDVITRGAHFRACRSILLGNGFPEVGGLFATATPSSGNVLPYGFSWPRRKGVDPLSWACSVCGRT